MSIHFGALLVSVVLNFATTLLAINHSKVVYVNKDSAVLSNQKGEPLATKALGGGGDVETFDISFLEIGWRMLTGEHECPDGAVWVGEMLNFGTLPSDVL